MRGSTATIRGRQERLRRRLPGCARRCSTWAVVAASFSASRATPASRRTASTATRHGRLLSRPRASTSSRATRSRYLGELEDGSLGGIFAAQVVEHLRPPALLRLLEFAAAQLRPGRHPRRRDDEPARARRAQELLRRPDARAAACSRDARHARPPGRASSARGPVPQRAAGGGAAASVELPPDAAFDEARRALAANVARLNEVVFGPQDYALVARR